MEPRDSQNKQLSETEDGLSVESTVPRSGPDELSQEYFSPLRLLFFIVISIFLAEVVAMVMVYSLPEFPYWFVTLIDAGIMTFLMFPLLYFLSFRPLIRHMNMRQRAEAANLQLSRIVQQTEDTVVVTNRDGIIEYVNPAFERLTGYTKEEALGKTPRVIRSDLHDREFYRNLWNTILKGHVFQSEIANRKKNGQLFYEVKTITPLRDVQGNITHFVATGKDITQQKLDEEKLLKAYDELELRVWERTEELRIANAELKDEIRMRRQTEAELRESEQRLKRAQEIAHLGSWELDLLNNQLTWSDEVYRIFGLQPQEFGATYEAFLEVVHPEDRAAVDAAYSGSIREGRGQYEIEHRVVRRTSGKVHIVYEKCEHFRNEAGQIVRSIGMVHDITERKQAEENIAYQARLLANVNDAIVGSDAEFRLTAWNAVAESVYGWKAEEVLGQNGLEILQTQWPQEDANEMRRMIAESGRWRGEATQLRKDGTRIPVEVSSMVLRDERGQVTGYVSVNHDITQRKQAEEALRKSEAKYRNLFENMTEEVHFWQLVYDEAGRIQTWRLVDANPPTLKTWNIKTVDEIKGKTTDEIFGPGATEHYMPVVQKIMTDGIPYSYEDYFPQLDKYFRFTSVPFGDHFITTGADITSLKKAEQALRTARDELELRIQERTEELTVANRELSNEIAERESIERQLRIQTTAMEAAANGIVITDPRGYIQWINPALFQISGYEVDELIGKHTHIFSSGQHDASYYGHMWETILAGRVWRGETVNRHKDGTLYVEEQTITPVQDATGKIQHFIAIKQDITDRKQAQAQLEQQNVELQAMSVAEREQRQFSEALASAALILSRSLKLDEVFSLILQQIREVISYEFANITLLDGETFYDASHEGDWSEPGAFFAAASRFPLIDFPLFQTMIQTSQSVLIDDTRCERDWVVLHGLGWSRSFLSTPLLVEGQVIGFVNLFASQPNFFTDAMRNRLTGFAAQASVAIQNAWLFEQVQASTERLQSLSRRLVEVQENERLYISRELHDEAGQVLTSLLVDLRLLEKNTAQPEAILRIVAEMERSLNAVIENLHRMAMALRPASLDHVGLVVALRQHVDTIREKHGINATFRSGAVIERLPANVEMVLYRTVQEALTNVIRHAHATRVDVVLTVRDNKLIVLVEDDGVGFDPGSVFGDDHLGLFGIRERTEMIGGTLEIETAPGKGTTIMLEVDYANTATGRR